MYFPPFCFPLFQFFPLTPNHLISRERIVPRAVLYFTGEALEEDSDFEEEESDEDDDDEDGEIALFNLLSLSLL